MNSPVRRVSQTPQIASGDVLPAKPYQSDAMFVESRLSLGIEPSLRLSWSVLPKFWSKGFTLMLFRNNKSFGEKYPTNLSRHGDLIMEAKRDGIHEERLPEGTFFYTFVLHKKTLFNLSENVEVLRFSETIPSAKVALGRIKDQMELEELRQKCELSPHLHEERLYEAQLRAQNARKKFESANETKSQHKPLNHADPVLAAELSAIDNFIDVLVANQSKHDAVRRDPRFQSLTPEAQEAVLRKIAERLNPGEISARQERRRS